MHHPGHNLQVRAHGACLEMRGEGPGIGHERIALPGREENGRATAQLGAQQRNIRGRGPFGGRRKVEGIIVGAVSGTHTIGAACAIGTAYAIGRHGSGGQTIFTVVQNERDYRLSSQPPGRALARIRTGPILTSPPR